MICAADSSPLFSLEEHVVSGARIELRVEIDQVNACVGNVCAKNFQIVAEVKPVHLPERITHAALLALPGPRRRVITHFGSKSPK